MLRRVLLPLLLVLSLPVLGAIESREFPNTELEQRYHVLIDKLRCLVCQNQNLADSNAELARDLRDRTYNMLIDGKSDDEITEFMVTRYGDFVLYEPPMNTHTLLLWSAPVIFFAIGAWVFISLIRRQKGGETAAVDADQLDKAKELLQHKDNNK